MVHTFSEAHSRASEKSIELEIAKELAESGANVVMAGTKPICSSWFNQEMSERMDRSMELNLVSLNSVLEFAETWNSSSRPLQLLINNAGTISTGEPLMVP